MEEYIISIELYKNPSVRSSCPILHVSLAVSKFIPIPLFYISLAAESKAAFFDLARIPVKNSAKYFAAFILDKFPEPPPSLLLKYSDIPISKKGWR